MERKNLITFKGNPLTLTGNDIKVGDVAPDFRVYDEALQEVTLKNFERSYRTS